MRASLAVGEISISEDDDRVASLYETRRSAIDDDLPSCLSASFAFFLRAALRTRKNPFDDRKGSTQSPRATSLCSVSVAVRSKRRWLYRFRTHRTRRRRGRWQCKCSRGRRQVNAAPFGGLRTKWRGCLHASDLKCVSDPHAAGNQAPATPLCLEAAGRRLEAPKGSFVCLHAAAIEQPRHLGVAVACFSDQAFQLVAVGCFVPPVLARHGGLLPYCSGREFQFPLS